MAKWRSKNYTVKLSRKTRLSFTLRHFRTAKQHRSKNYRQLIIQTHLKGVREIAVSLQRKGKKRKTTALALRKLQQLHVTASTVFVISGLAGVGICSISLVNAQIPVPPVKTFTTNTQSANPAKSTPDIPVGLPYSEPTHISIPDVGIDTNIMSVGQTAQGTMETPPVESGLAGWYRLGPTPGQIGPAIIVGHLDTYTTVSIFWRLREVQPGSLVQINRADGTVATFKVTGLDRYEQDNFPTEKVYGNINYSGLRLITCGGAFNYQTGHYVENTVVSAELVIEQEAPPTIKAVDIGTTLLPKPTTFESYLKTSQ